MNNEYLTMAEIETKYPNEWVLIDRPRTGRNLTDLLGGYVAIHSSNRIEFDNLTKRDEQVKDCAVLYVGVGHDDDLYLL